MFVCATTREHKQPSHPTLAPPPIMGYNEALYEVEFSAWQIATLERVFYGALALIGPANGAGPRLAEAPRARNLHLMARPSVACTVA